MAIYNEFRPQVWSAVKGQDVIVKTLTNQIARKKLSHSYVFSGTRGTGKTTMAKLFARSINCENPINGFEPCGCCNFCKQKTTIAIQEIDAASNNGVDNIRDINDNVRYRPTDGRYKVFIIDEAHMLSNGAFNAMLKTLEEPPEYVVFILCTTEPEKIPITILSRCQQYALNRIDAGIIAQQLLEVCNAKMISIEQDALMTVAKMAEGSMRDGESLLDTVMSYIVEGTITNEIVLQALGTPQKKDIRNLVYYIGVKSVVDSMNIVEHMVAIRGIDVKKLTEDIIQYYRNMMIYMASGNNAITNLSAADERALQINIGVYNSLDVVMRNIRVFNELLQNLRMSSMKRVALEVAVIKAMTPQMESDPQSMKLRLEQVEKAIGLN